MTAAALTAAVFAAAAIPWPARANETKDEEEAAAEVSSSENNGNKPEIPSGELGQFCFFAGSPPPGESYTVIRQFKIGKGTYGGVKDILPRVASRVRKMGADAVINYTSSQRFGFFPWRVVRPVVGGVAIKWTDPQKNRDCEAMGGSSLQTILANDEPPRRRQPTQATHPSRSPTSSTSIADRLKTLEDLRDRNLVSPAEYEERRRKILDGL